MKYFNRTQNHSCLSNDVWVSGIWACGVYCNVCRRVGVLLKKQRKRNREKRKRKKKKEKRILTAGAHSPQIQNSKFEIFHILQAGTGL